jgi:tetratricopeptide (TPR) repeat protein
MERAREACEKALELNSKAAVGHVCLGTIYNGTGEYQRAVEQFANALDLESDNDEAYRGLAWSHEHMNNWEAAEGTYLKAIQVQPSYYFNYQMLGQFYLFSRQQYADAIDVYLVATQRSPENDEPYLGLCGAYILAGHYTDAVQTCKKAIGLKEDPLSYMNLGVAYWDLRDYASAAQSFERAVELNTNYYKTVGHLARTYSWLPEKRAQAPELYRKAISLADDELRVNPHDPDTHVMVARYHAMLGHRVEALSHLQEAFSIRPKDAEYHEIAAVIHNQFGETSVAIGYLERAISAGYSIGEIETERELDNLRADSRFRALISSQTK